MSAVSPSITPSATDALTTREVVADAVDVLNDQAVILGSGRADHAVAGLLAALVDLHDSTALNLETFPEVRALARLIMLRSAL